MLDKILEADSLGDKEQINYMLDVVKSGDHTISSLMQACFARSYAFRSSFPGLLWLLASIGYLSVEGDGVGHGEVSSTELQDGFLEVFCQRLFGVLADAGVLHHIFNNRTLSIDALNRIIYLKNNKVPIRYAALRNLLISLGLLARALEKDNVFVIVAKHHDWFRQGLIVWAGQSEERQGQTLEQLKRRLSNQESAGRMAEEFVVAYEKNRLKDHAAVEEVRMISDQAVGAGYDVLSFEGKDSVLFDRFIEVKSFTGDASFYWSLNEIRAAKDKGSGYFICLVNRDEMNRSDYTPTFVQNPARSMFSDKRWEHTCDRFFFSKK